jgi:hypothetical protein
MRSQGHPWKSRQGKGARSGGQAPSTLSGFCSCAGGETGALPTASGDRPWIDLGLLQHMGGLARHLMIQLAECQVAALLSSDQGKGRRPPSHRRTSRISKKEAPQVLGPRGSFRRVGSLPFKLTNVTLTGRPTISPEPLTSGRVNQSIPRQSGLFKIPGVRDRGHLQQLRGDCLRRAPSRQSSAFPAFLEAPEAISPDGPPAPAQLILARCRSAAFLDPGDLSQSPVSSMPMAGRWLRLSASDEVFPADPHKHPRKLGQRASIVCEV